MARLVLIPSPFVGAASWARVAARLPDAVAADYGGVRGPDWYDGVAGRLRDQVGEGPWVAVMHSGAGGFAPALAAAHANLAGLVFVDAVRPYPGRSNLAAAPPAFAQHLSAITRHGLLPPWNAWFEPDPTLRLIPDPEDRATFIADLPRVPFAYLEAVSPDEAAWEALPAAYVRLSAVYDEQADWAEQRGWQVRRARLNHLSPFTAPDAVAELLYGLAQPS